MVREASRQVSEAPVQTIWVFGDQLNRRIGALAGARPEHTMILMIESESMLSGRPFHRQRLHLVLTAMRRFADSLRKAGFAVDYRRAATLSAGLTAHRDRHGLGRVTVTEPNSAAVDRLVRRLDVEIVPSNQFLLHRHDFGRWAEGRTRMRLEDFYRHQRGRSFLRDRWLPSQSYFVNQLLFETGPESG